MQLYIVFLQTASRLRLFSFDPLFVSVAQTAVRERKRELWDISQKNREHRRQKNLSGIITLSDTSCSNFCAQLNGSRRAATPRNNYICPFTLGVPHHLWNIFFRDEIKKNIYIYGKYTSETFVFSFLFLKNSKKYAKPKYSDTQYTK